MDQSAKTSTRKKFLLMGATLISAVTFSKYFSRTKKNVIACGSESKPVLMLGEDGRLVQIDKKELASSGKKISNEELKNWIKK